MNGYDPFTNKTISLINSVFQLAAKRALQSRREHYGSLTDEVFDVLCNVFDYRDGGIRIRGKELYLEKMDDHWTMLSDNCTEELADQCKALHAEAIVVRQRVIDSLGAWLAERITA